MTNLTDFAWHVPVEEPFSFFLSTDPRDPTAGHAFLDACSVARRIINEDEYEALKKAHQRDYVGVVSFAAWLTKRMHEFYRFDRQSRRRLLRNHFRVGKLLAQP